MKAAQRVFARRGFHAATLDDIATEAGFSTGAVYSNFKGKEDLFFALFEEHVAERIRTYRRLFESGATQGAQARRGADDWMNFVDTNPHFIQLFVEFWAYSLRNPRLRRRFTTRFGAFREAIGEMIQAASADRGIQVSASTARQLGAAINALGIGLAFEKLADPEDVPNELFGSLLESLVPILLSGIEAQQGR